MDNTTGWVLARKLGSYYEFVSFSEQQADEDGYGYNVPTRVDTVDAACVWRDKGALIDEIALVRRWGFTATSNLGSLNEWRVMQVKQVSRWMLVVDHE